MRPETRATRLIEAGTLPAQWQLLTPERRAYARHLVSDFHTPVRIAIQRAYIFGFDAYAYDYRSGETVRDQWTHRRPTGRHYYAVRYAYRDAMSDSDALVRFDTYEARRVFCEENENAEPVRIADVRHRFDVREFNRIPDSAQVCPQPVGDAYEVRQVDALAYDDGWTYNETYRLGTFTTTGDAARALRRYLAKSGITFYPGRTATEYDGDVYEIVDRKTGEPLFCAIPAAEEA